MSRLLRTQPRRVREIVQATHGVMQIVFQERTSQSTGPYFARQVWFSRLNDVHTRTLHSNKNETTIAHLPVLDYHKEFFYCFQVGHSPGFVVELRSFRVFDVSGLDFDYTMRFELSLLSYRYHASTAAFLSLESV
jgi:hypothetical protein